jgi:two-component system cell cycle sensor histidine kinase/response regulator CckA
MRTIFRKGENVSPPPRWLPDGAGTRRFGEEGNMIDTVAQVEMHGSRVVVVEDEALIRTMIADVLADHGFHVEAFGNASDALRHLTCGAPCDVLFTDINLPGLLDGAKLAKLARALRPDLPVVYASGAYNRMQDIESVPGADFLSKPYDPEQVCELLGRKAAH